VSRTNLANGAEGLNDVEWPVGVRSCERYKASKPIQMAFNWEAGVKPQGPGVRGDSLTARQPTEHPMFPEYLMEEMVERHNMQAALKQVRANKGSAGIDGMSVWR
jgi:hypothetical protein